jgi:HipA-like kinase
VLEFVTAVRFDGRMKSGKTRPCLLTCNDETGSDVELIAKFSAGCERDVRALVAEAISAMLASDLDLPVPEPFLVDLQPEFIATIPDADIVNLASTAAPVAFGSKKLPAGFTTLPVGKSVPKEMLGQAIEIFAFDGLIQNADRRPDNPNCLSDGRSLAIYDHELAFMTKGIIGWVPPWQEGGLSFLAGHLFYEQLKGRDIKLDRLVGALEAVSEDRLEEYRNALPAAWSQDDGLAVESLEYIAQVKANLDDVVTEVARVLV